MEIKATLNKPCTDDERIAFIMEYNRNLGYFVEERQDCLVALWYTEEELEEQHREYLDSLCLTPSDVERALYRAKGMDFEDLKAIISQALPQLDMKGLAIEFRANNFYRGVTVNGMRLFDVVGLLLGYTPEDMDYLFEHKELPTPNSTPTEESTSTSTPTEEPKVNEEPESTEEPEEEQG